MAMTETGSPRFETPAKTHANSVTTAKPTAEQRDLAWAIARACAPTVQPDISDMDAIVHWLGRGESPAIRTMEQAARAVEDGLSRRVGRNRASFSKIERQAIVALERLKRSARDRDRDLAWSEARIQAQDGLPFCSDDMNRDSVVAHFASYARLRWARQELRDERLTGRLLDNAIRWKMEQRENIDSPARYTFCACGTIFEKPRPNATRCPQCRNRDTRAKAPDHVIDVQLVTLPSGEVGRRYVSICTACNSDFIVIGPNTRGRYRGLCDDCEPDHLRQRRSRAVRKSRGG